MGGMQGSGTATTNVPNPTPLQTALGAGTTLAGIYGGLTKEVLNLILKEFRWIIMSRTLKRPMFRMGGSTGTGITSGLDQPRKQYREGTPNPYAMGNFAPGTGAGFLTSFGLDLMSRSPQGNLLQTAALSAKEPFKDFQAAQFRRGEKMGERDFLQSERKAGEEFKAGESQLNRDTQLEIAGMRNDKTDALYNTMLEKYVTDGLPPQAAERAATFDTQLADTLRGAIGGE